jgi:hypothetical protein
MSNIFTERNNLGLAVRTVVALFLYLSLTGCATLSWNGVYRGRTVDAQEPNSSRTETCSAVCAQLNPNGQCGRWVEPVGEACRASLRK